MQPSRQFPPQPRPADLRRRAWAWRWLLVLALIAGLAAPVLPKVGRARAQDEGVPLPVGRFGEHPRLLITPSYINRTLQPRVQATTPAWGTFAAYVQSDAPETDAAWTPGTALRSLALAWLVTDNTDYAERARRVMIGLVNRVETDPIMFGTGGISAAFADNVANLAVGYDWLYGYLNVGDRAALQDTLLRATTRLLDANADTQGVVWRDGELMVFDDVAPRWLWALTAVGLALYGEHDNAEVVLDYCRDLLTGVDIPALELQSGGAWAGGPGSGFTVGWTRVQMALAWWTALGENYFDDTRWWYDRLAYDLFLYHPQPTTVAATGEPIPGYPAIIGDTPRRDPSAAYGRAQDLMLRTVFKDYDHAAWMDWYLHQPPDGMPGWLAVEEFLWRDADSLGAPPPLLTWSAPYNGHVFMRSHWLDGAGGFDPAATYVSFTAGDRLSSAQFYDQGSFTIYTHRADLVARSGTYGGGTSDLDANYTARTIAANSILVCDLAEIFDGIRPNDARDLWLNDCGQRTMDPAGASAVNVDHLLANWRVYDTGSITRLGETGSVTYLRADLTGAYNSAFYATPANRAKIDAVVREFIYWRPGIVFVADRIVPSYPTYTPMTVFHFPSPPTPIGLYFKAQTGAGAVYLQNLLPNSRTNLVEGYEVSGLVLDPPDGDPYAPYRLEIVPGGPEVDYWFLSAFVVQAADAPPPPESVLVTGAGVRGVALGTVQAMFDTRPEDGTDLAQTSFQIMPGVQYTLLSGLTPDAVYVVQAEGNLTKTLTADAAGTILIADVPPGTVYVGPPAE